MKRNHVTVLLGDPNLPDRSKPGHAFTADDHFQVEKLREALAEIESTSFEFWNDHAALIRRLEQEPPSFVLNFCDTGYRNNARHELHVAALLDMMNVPYSGSGPVALGLCYDKALVRAVAAAHGVPVAKEVFVSAGDPLPEIDYPAFMKPNSGDGSVGITEHSIVQNRREALAQLARLREELPGVDVLLQEYLTGAEYSVGLIGNPDTGFTMLPPLEVNYDALDPDLPRLLSYASKTDPESPYWTDISFEEARVSEKSRASMRAWCIRLFQRLQLRDYGRFDFRGNANGQLSLMEVNPNPAWCWDGKLAHMGRLAGLSHGAVLGQILEAARMRTGV
ncbi:MAG: D-alanine--D-alanine ligase [Gammaproteobacteria bacterium]